MERQLNPDSRIDSLSIAIIVLLGSYMDRASRVVFSLSCKAFRNILSSNLDLSLKDKDIRIRFLRCLEVDHPEYLTCRKCGWMFLWRKRAPFHYRCPRFPEHGPSTSWLGFMLEQWVFNSAPFNLEMFELISRGHKRGLLHGLQASSLNNTATGIDGIRREVEARWARQQLLVATTRTISPISRSDILIKPWCCEGHTCQRCLRNLGHRTPAIIDTIEELREEGSFDLIHCNSCQTACKMTVQTLDNGLQQVIFKRWQSYGNSDNVSYVETGMWETPEYGLARYFAVADPRRDLECYLTLVKAR